MICNKNLAPSLCNQYTVGINCLQTFYENSSYNITLQLYNSDGTLLNLDNIRTINIGLYDIRKKVIATYIYPHLLEDSSFTDDTEITDEDEYLYRNIEFKDVGPFYFNLDITILQYNHQTFDTFDNEFETEYDNMGKIRFTLTKEITSSLYPGAIYIDIKLVTINDEDIIIPCYKIGYVSNYNLNLI